jgi:hypothetical protein
MPLKSKPKGAAFDLQHLLFVAFNLNILGFNGDTVPDTASYIRG